MSINTFARERRSRKPFRLEYNQAQYVHTLSPKASFSINTRFTRTQYSEENCKFIQLFKPITSRDWDSIFYEFYNLKRSNWHIPSIEFNPRIFSFVLGMQESLTFFDSCYYIKTTQNWTTALFQSERITIILPISSSGWAK